MDSIIFRELYNTLELSYINAKYIYKMLSISFTTIVCKTTHIWLEISIKLENSWVYWLSA